jgi:hypothetical protein
VREFTLRIDNAIDLESGGLRTARELIGCILQGPISFVPRVTNLDERLGGAAQFIKAGYANCTWLQKIIAESDNISAEIMLVSETYIKLHLKMSQDRYLKVTIQAISGKVIYVRKILI